MVLLEHDQGTEAGHSAAWSSKRAAMIGPLELLPKRTGSTRRAALGMLLAAPAVGCASVQSTLSNFSTYLPGQGPAEVLTSSLFTRFRSRQEHTFAEKVLSAMRAKFGGHSERPH